MYSRQTMLLLLRHSQTIARFHVTFLQEHRSHVRKHMHGHILTYTPIHIRIYTQMCTHVYMHSCTHTRLHIHARNAHTHTPTHARTTAHTCACTPTQTNTFPTCCTYKYMAHAWFHIGVAQGSPPQPEYPPRIPNILIT